ncbi:hypothetical protein L596_023231 [Steinernema carpocapsae]|uniref:Fatty-acid and retinol-binding protein 1 n=1 Tax=Steinernema carpocapsae TaxID=34508 RepID=A0A4V5ZZC4_STECR|nr:hypothetical protein L596_023231 [Steinernema carpocapsae]
MKPLIVLVTLLALLHALPVPQDNDFQQLLPYVPSEFIAFWRSLTMEEATYIAGLYPKLQTEESPFMILEEVSKHSHSLYERFTSLIDHMYTKMARLSTTSREFLGQIGEKILAIEPGSKGQAKPWIKEAKAMARNLDRKYQREISKNFPTLRKLFEDEEDVIETVTVKKDLWLDA